MNGECGMEWRPGLFRLRPAVGTSAQPVARAMRKSVLSGFSRTERSCQARG